MKCREDYIAEEWKLCKCLPGQCLCRRRLVPGYEGKYIIDLVRGRLYRYFVQRNCLVAEHCGRVRLYRRGQVWRPNINTLMQRALAENWERI